MRGLRVTGLGQKQRPGINNRCAQFAGEDPLLSAPDISTPNQGAEAAHRIDPGSL